MELLLTAIGVILAIMLYGYIVRKNIYREVDKIDAWKMDMMNRPVTDEIAEVKKLKMTGQTEEKFEQWRNTWDEIVTVGIPKIEDRLFDAEEAADRYTFKKARQIIAEMTDDLQQMESKISDILSQLRELIGSEEKNRIEIEEHKQTIKAVRKTLLAQGHEFGKSASEFLEKDIKLIEEKITLFDTATESGNYLQARDMILEMTEEVQLLSEKVSMIPSLFHECRIELPSQVRELKNGCQEMVENGFVLDTAAIQNEIDTISDKLATYINQLENADITGIPEGIDSIKNRIDSLYELLEKEVVARHIVGNEVPMLGKELYDVKKNFKRTKEETEHIQLSYELKEEDLERIMEMDKAINLAIKRSDALQERITENKTPSSLLQKELEHIHEQIARIKEEHEEFHSMLVTLRKDETEAIGKITEMKRLLLEAKRMVQKSNLPGLPEFYFIEYETAESNIGAVAQKMSEKPLNMNAVKLLLEEAVGSVQRLYDRTSDMIEKAELTEKVIQYGNRYRSTYPIIAAKLNEAEYAFRMFDYEAALEQAAIAIEEIEPGAMKKLEKILEYSQV